MKLPMIAKITAIACLLSSSVLAYDYPKPDKRMVPLDLGCSAPGMVALTFDDGPHNNTPTILETLAQHDAKATFYVLGFKLTKSHYLETARDMLAAGHQIENHSWDHPNFLELSDEQIKKQVNDTNQVLWDELGVVPRFVRPPYGRIDVPKAMPIWNLGYGISLWNLDPQDYKSGLFWGPNQVYQEIVKALDNADPSTHSFNVLLHDSSATSVEKLGDIILLVKSKGYRLVTLDECVDSGPEY